MNIDTTITIDTALNIGLALLGWFYIMFSAGEVGGLCFSKAVGKAPQTGKTPESVRGVL